MVRLVCSKCEFSTTAHPADGEHMCPSCGSGLVRCADEHLQRAAAVEEQLIADVREAFETSEFGLHPDDTRWCIGAAIGAAADTAELTTGRLLGDFEIVEEIGRGGMGVVYRARQVSLERTVALKVLLAFPRRHRSAVRRFRTEAQAVARLNHPNVVPVYAQGEYEGHLYYAMELIDGLSLDVAIRSKPELLSSTFWREGSVTTKAGQCTQRSGVALGNEVEDAERTPAPSSTQLSHRTLADFRHLAGLVAEHGRSRPRAGRLGDQRAHAALCGVVDDTRRHLPPRHVHYCRLHGDSGRPGLVYGSPRAGG